MSQESVEVVRRWTDGIERGDLGFECWDPDLQIENAAGWPVEATYHGHDGLERWWQDLAEAFTDFRMEVEEIVAVDEERVLTCQRFVGHFRATGIALDGPWASLLWVRGGKIVHAKGYLSKSRAMRAAGLEA